jgi:hypothetical protein
MGMYLIINRCHSATLLRYIIILALTTSWSLCDSKCACITKACDILSDMLQAMLYAVKVQRFVIDIIPLISKSSSSAGVILNVSFLS